MSDKRRRLRELASHTDYTPATCWTPEEFTALEPDAQTRWWVRLLSDVPSERWGHRQGPWTPAEVNMFLEDTAGDALSAIQEYVEPEVAGATVCTVDGILTEGVRGPAAPLLRGGAVGDVIASHDHQISWRLDRCGLDLERVHESIPPQPGVLWEWIVDRSGRVFHVDRKPLPTPLLEAVPRSGPPERWCIGPPRSGPVVELPTTAIGGLEHLDEPCVLRIGAGSPLAHLCYEAVVRGSSVDLAGLE